MTTESIGDLKQGDSVESIWNNEKMRHVRRQFLSGNVPRGCEACKMKEEASGTSRRTHFADDIKWWNLEVDFSKLTEYSDLDAIALLDLGHSRVCNQRCRFCSPQLSTKWVADAKILLAKDRDFWNLAVGIPISFKPNIEQYLSLFPKLKSLRRVEIKGGEPALWIGQSGLLQRLIEIGVSGHIELAITSNGSVVIPEADFLFSKFKAVYFNFSIDGVGGLHRYIRGDQTISESTLEQNMRAYSRIPRVHMGVNFTLCAYNVFGVRDFFRWIQKMRREMQLSLAIGFIAGPEPLRVDYLPFAFRKLALERIRDIQDPAVALIRAALSQKAPDKDPVQCMEEFKRFTRDLDELRNESLVDVVPEFQQLFSPIVQSELSPFGNFLKTCVFPQVVTGFRRLKGPLHRFWS